LDHHRWVIIQRDGQVVSGDDDFPSDLAKLRAKAFVLRLNGAPPIELQVPEGFGLVFKRRNQIYMAEDGAEVGRGCIYIIALEPLKQERSEVADHAKS
jgi:hypothetical protein